MAKNTSNKSGEVEPQDVAKLREEGLNWAEVSERLGISAGRAMFLFEVSQVTSKNKITGTDEEDLKKKIAQARIDGLSWGIIMARSGMSEGFCRKAFEEVTKQSASGNRIGKGGRFPSGVTQEASPAKLKKAEKAEKAVKAVKKAPPAKATKAVKAAKKEAPAKPEKATKKAAKKSVKKEEA